MKKRIVVLSFFFMNFAIYGAVPSEPEIYADISEEAQEDSIKFDGLRLLAGLLYSQCKLTVGITDKPETASHTMGFIGGTIGGEYAKSFKKNFLFALNLSVNITKKGKKSGSWEEINPAYDKSKGPAGTNKREAQFEIPSFVPSVSLKVGYQFKSWASLLFLEAGCHFAENIKCRYSQNDQEAGSAEMTYLTPNVGLGVEKKFNSKWSAVIKANMSLNKTSKKMIDKHEHRVKMRRISASIMGVLTTKSN